MRGDQRMIRKNFLQMLFVALTLSAGVSVVWAAETGAGPKKRIFIVSSYHREYLWSNETHQGVCDAMRAAGYLDSAQQAEELLQTDRTESSRAVVWKAWMNSQRRNSAIELGQITHAIIEQISLFKPDIVLLGDDNAANYIGNQLLDGDIPVVFWGINGLPLKYGLVESIERPGHNITGVYQIGYLKESLELLKKIAPAAQTFAVLACDSETTRPMVKKIEILRNKNSLPLSLSAIICTNSWEEFQQQTLLAAETVDAFLVLNYDTLRDNQGRPVDIYTAGKWYLDHIRKPEATATRQHVRAGLLCAADDSGYRQGYEAFCMAAEILEGRRRPAEIPSICPPRGSRIVNRQRAAALGISLAGLEPADFDELIDEARALEKSE
ncbi:MAG: hypothetical protein NC924_07585 [Candidatus Omnitrophica bacterium]|nr:hypothetical protein [Candidatus Omnitrophota bacterium]